MQWYLLALGSAVLNALSSVTEKKALFKEHAMEYAAVVSLFMFFLSIPLIPRSQFNISPAYWFILFLLSILDAVAFLYITKAVRHMELSESSPLFVYGPVITAIFAYAFLKEALTIKEIGGVIGVTLGAYMLELKPMKNKKGEFFGPFKVIMQSKYIHYLLFGLMLYALSAVITRYLLNTNNPQAIDANAFLVVTHFFVAVVYIAMICKYYNGFQGIKHGIQKTGRPILLAAIFLFTSRILLTIALAIPVAEVALILGVRRLSSLFSTVIGGEMFHDQYLSRKIIACIVMIASAFFIIL